MSFGIMRLVNIAHGDLIVLSAYVALVVDRRLPASIRSRASSIVVPVMFALGYALQRGLLNQTLSGGLLPPLLVTFGISIIIQNGLLQVFGAYDHRLQEGAIETASLHFPGGISIGVYPLLVFARGDLRHRQPAALVLPHRPRPRLSRRLRRCRHRRADGHRQPQALCAGARHRDDLHGDRRRAVWHPHHLRSGRRDRSG